MNDIPIVIMTSHIGQGSNFVRSLIDGHPEIALIRQDMNYTIFIDAYNSGNPFDAKAFSKIFFKDYYDFPVVSKDYIQNLRSLNTDNRIYNHNFKNWNNIRQRVQEELIKLIKEGKVKNLIDFLFYVAIHQYELEFPKAKPKAVFINVHCILIDKSLGWPPKAGALSYGAFGGEFMKLFSNDIRIKVLALARDPYALYGCAIYTPRRARLPIYGLSQILIENLFYRKKWKNLFGEERFQSLKMEDLQIEPDDTLKKLSAFMKVAYIPQIMKKTTVFGHFWEGKSQHGPIKTFDSSLKSNNIWIETLTFFELLAVTVCSINIFKELNYNRKVNPILSFLLFPIAIFFISIQIRNFKFLKKHNPTISKKKYMLSSFKHVFRTLFLFAKRPLAFDSLSVKALMDQQPATFK